MSRLYASGTTFFGINFTGNNLKLGNNSINRPDDIALMENSVSAQTPNRIELRTSATNAFDLKSEHID